MFMFCIIPLLVFSHAVLSNDTEPGKALDFWVGDWKMDSSQPDDPETKGAWQKDLCTNKVSKAFGGKVIQEQFNGGGLKGGSWSSYDAKKKVWHQTWVDDSGAYLLFEGGQKGDEFVLTQTNSVKGHARMRFANFKQDMFDWYWEMSDDGKNWKLAWHLKYHH